MTVNATWRDYFELCKPRVVALMLLTTVVGMYLASAQRVPLQLLFTTCLGVGLSASAAAAINHIIDRHIDSKMQRTEKRPIATGRVPARFALLFAMVLASIGLTVLVVFVNRLTALLTFLTLIGYAIIYTGFLKRLTPQNIVIGGLAGATPPLLGWTAVTGHISANSLLLVLIIFVWTPPHFWALAIARHKEYAKVAIPMLPVTHGIEYTKLSILLYTALLFAVSLLPFVTGLSSVVYLLGATLLGIAYLRISYRLYRSTDLRLAMPAFHFSNTYLILLFVVLLLDHYYPLYA